jgi:hypothetical protein
MRRTGSVSRLARIARSPSMMHSASAAAVAVVRANSRAGARMIFSGTFSATFQPLNGAVAQYSRFVSPLSRKEA